MEVKWSIDRLALYHTGDKFSKTITLDICLDHFHEFLMLACQGATKTDCCDHGRVKIAGHLWVTPHGKRQGTTLPTRVERMYSIG